MKKLLKKIYSLLAYIVKIFGFALKVIVNFINNEINKMYK